MNRKIKIINHLSNNGKANELKVENIEVEVSYSKNNKRLDDCILNILKQKMKK